MTKDNFELYLRTFTRRRPFRSFLIEFSSGDRISIGHPEAVMGLGNLFVFRAPNRELRIFEHQTVIQFIDPPPKISS